MAVKFRSGETAWVAICSVLLVGSLMQGPALRAQAPPSSLDEKRLGHIVMTFHAWESKFEWAKLKEDGEKIVPYVAYILADNESKDRVVERAMIFARENLTKYDCKSLLEPTLEHLRHHDWQVRAEALMLLEKIGSKEDCAPVAVLLYAEDKHNRIGAAYTLAKLGGKRELLALDLWLKDSTRLKDEAFEEVKKSRDELRTRVEDEEKKLKAKPPEKKDEKK
jgi:hypothetical protein